MQRNRHTAQTHYWRLTRNGVHAFGSDDQWNARFPAHHEAGRELDWIADGEAVVATSDGPDGAVVWRVELVPYTTARGIAGPGHNGG